MPDICTYSGDLALFPQTVKGNVIEVNVDLYCHKGIFRQRPLWEPMINEEIVYIIQPDHPAYKYLLQRLIKIENAGFDTWVPPKTLAMTSFMIPKLCPGPLAYDLNGKIPPAVKSLLDDPALLQATIRWGYFDHYETLLTYIPAATRAVWTSARKIAPSQREELRSLLKSWNLLNEG